MPSDKSKELLIFLSAVTLAALLFAVDIFTPFLHNVWFLYTFPLLLSFPSNRKGASYILSAVITLFIVIEILWFNKPAVPADIWKLSHVYAFIVFWIMAALLERYKRSIGFNMLNDKIKETNEELLKEVQERRQAEEKLRKLSIIDELTGLYNRRGFFELAEKQLALAGRNGIKALLIFMDMDNFKKINDTFGHKEGDNALMDMNTILRGTFRQSDIIARMGGDEFVVFSSEETEDTVGSMMARLQRNTAEYNERNTRPYQLSLSAGHAFCESDEKCTIDKLLEIADGRMYGQKLQKNKKL